MRTDMRSEPCGKVHGQGIIDVTRHLKKGESGVWTIAHPFAENLS
jgi:hypothetical protein